MKCIKCDKDALQGSSLCQECASEEQASAASGEPQTALAPANLLARLAAYAFDTALLMLLALFILLAVPNIGRHISTQSLRDFFSPPVLSSLSSSSTHSLQPKVLKMLALGLSCLLGLPWYLVFEHVLGGTPGKRVLGLAVLSIEGREPTLIELAARYIGRFLWTVPLAVAVFAAVSAQGSSTTLVALCCLITIVVSVFTYSLILVTPRRRGLHDLASGCIVVQARPFSAVASTAVFLFFFSLALVIQLVSTWPFRSVEADKPAAAPVEETPPESGLQPPPAELLSVRPFPEAAPTGTTETVEAIPELTARVGGRELHFTSAIGYLSDDGHSIEIGFFDRKLTEDQIEAFASLPFDSPRAPIQAQAGLTISFTSLIESSCRFESVRFFKINLPGDRGSRYLTLTRIGKAHAREEVAAISCEKVDEDIRFVGAFTGRAPYRYADGMTTEVQWTFTFSTRLHPRKSEVIAMGEQ